ncbi:InlB B-repeat-containing protein [Ketobacter sp.]|uniref:InlB B-repeat-containing protein n=1 Tax=Ketobacter sp. TaxID=2083498 RepID=UPI000F1752BA|nr:hypothetical protein [Ketobacter sp.]RLT96337.1 MAG: hypothetical protein D9N14_13670 [Ketobacter sp.]
MKSQTKLWLTSAATLLLAACGGGNAGGTLTVSQPVGGTIVSADGNIQCGADCEHDYTSDTTVTLTATAQAGYQFLNWLDDCSGTEATCEVTVSDDRTVGAVFNENSDPGIGAVLQVRAGTVINLNYTGSTDPFDYAGIYALDGENTQYLERSRLAQDFGSTTIRVPTIAGTYQFRMINNKYETIVIDDNLEVLPYNTQFNLETPALSPEDVVRVSYQGSTHDFDYIAVIPEGGTNTGYASRARLADPEGEVDLSMPAQEGRYEIRMINNKYETISSSLTVDLSYSASVSTVQQAYPGQTINVSFSGSTQDFDYIALYPQNVANTGYLSRVRLAGVSSGTVQITLPDATGMYTVKMINQGYETMASHEYVSVLDSNAVEVFVAPDLALRGETLTIAYSGVSGGEAVALFEQGAPNSAPLASAAIGVVPAGNIQLPAPDAVGYYELRLLSAAQQTLAAMEYVKVIDPAQVHVEIPQTVQPGDTIPIIFSGSADNFDYIAIYPLGEDNLVSYTTRIRVADANGMVDFRMPTVAGQYVVRLINSQYELLDEGNTFTVEPYAATVTLSSYEVTPGQSIDVQYTGSTNGFDYVAFYAPGATNTQYTQRVRLPQDAGEVSVTAPSAEGAYQIRMINNAYETILEAGVLDVAYDDAFVGGPEFGLPGQQVTVSFNGSTEDFDYVALYAQHAANTGYLSRVRLNGVTEGDVTLNLPEQTGMYDVRMINNGYVTIADGVPIAVLDPSLSEIFTAPVWDESGSQMHVAYSHPLALEGATVGVYAQGAANNMPIAELPASEFPQGRVTMNLPANAGIYHVRLVSAEDQTLASARLVYSINPAEENLFIPDEVRAGETLWVGFSGSDDAFDYAASYPVGQSNNTSYYNRERLAANYGVVSLRVPTVAGEYDLRMISNSYVTQVEGNRFTVAPYNATAGFVSVAEPTQSIQVSYSGSTDPFDYFAFYAPGAANTSYVGRVRLPSESGVASINMPDTEGQYEVRLINNKYETIAELGTILAAYNSSISVSAQELASPGEEITVSFVGSTEDWDYIALYPQHATNTAYLTRVRLNGLNEGAIPLQLPTETGIYDIRMINRGYVTMSNNITVSVLDQSLTELFIAPEIAAPGAPVTFGYSGSFAAGNTIGIYHQLSGAALNTGTLPVGFGNATLTAPAADGVYHVEMRNGSNQALAQANLLYVLDPSRSAVHGPAVVRAGDTVRFIYSGVTGSFPRIAFYAAVPGEYSALSSRLPAASGAQYLRVPTVAGTYRVQVIDNNNALLIDGHDIVIEPYDGDIDPE